MRRRNLKTPIAPHTPPEPENSTYRPNLKTRIFWEIFWFLANVKRLYLLILIRFINRL